MVTRIKVYWDARTRAPGWSWEVWDRHNIVDSGGEAADYYDTADQAVTELAAVYGIELQSEDIANHPTEDGGWAEWRQLEEEK